jgi:hypothetical protein
MRFPSTLFLVACALLVSLSSSPVLAQTVAGAITGTVVDSSNLAVPSAKVSLLDEASGVVRSASPATSGAFVFTAVPPGVYTIRVENPGLSTAEKKNVNLTANERLAAGEFVLRPSAVSDTITVTSAGAAVEVESNDRSSILTGDQMKTLMSRGGNMAALLTLLPGAVGSETEFERDFFGTHQTPNFGGVSNLANSIKVDGLTGSDPVNPQYQINPVSMNSISEVKVLLANYKAEYGSNGGAVVVAITKSGTRGFHGSLNSNWRNDFLNANNYFNNLNNVPRARYRFLSLGANFGGPVYIPGKFNTAKNKLFFFYAQDNNHAAQPGNLVQATMPTALERTGDYSQIGRAHV